MRYFITFVCYGTRLHGDEAGSVDRDHNVPGSRFAEGNAERLDMKRRQMEQAPYLLDVLRRATVLAAFHEVCLYRGWKLWAAHVRTNHVHVIVEADVRPEMVMHSLKSYATRSLNLLPEETNDRRRWARHGSTRWLWNDTDVQEAIRYVVYGQGEPMEVYLAELV